MDPVLDLDTDQTKSLTGIWIRSRSPFINYLFLIFKKQDNRIFTIGYGSGDKNKKILNLRVN